MKVYVVLEEDRGCGPEVVGVFRSKVAAQACVDQNPYRRWLVEEELQ